MNNYSLSTLTSELTNGIVNCINMVPGAGIEPALDRVLSDYTSIHYTPIDLHFMGMLSIVYYANIIQRI